MKAGQIFINVLISLCVLLIASCLKHVDADGGEYLIEFSGKEDPIMAGKVNFPVSCRKNI